MVDGEWSMVKVDAGCWIVDSALRLVTGEH